jgi:hypothetical protein
MLEMTGTRKEKDPMRRCLYSIVLVLATTGVAHAAPYQTTYGEDPIPDARLLRGPIVTTYGQDPVPAKSLSQRIWELRNRPARISNYTPGSQFEIRPGSPTIVNNKPKAPSARRRW